jgi:hypothetical protein
MLIVRAQDRMGKAARRIRLGQPYPFARCRWYQWPGSGSSGSSDCRSKTAICCGRPSSARAKSSRVKTANDGPVAVRHVDKQIDQLHVHVKGELLRGDEKRRESHQRTQSREEGKLDI